MKNLTSPTMPSANEVKTPDGHVDRYAPPLTLALRVVSATTASPWSMSLPIRHRGRRSFRSIHGQLGKALPPAIDQVRRPLAEGMPDPLRRGVSPTPSTPLGPSPRSPRAQPPRSPATSLLVASPRCLLASVLLPAVPLWDRCGFFRRVIRPRRLSHAIGYALRTRRVPRERR